MKTAIMFRNSGTHHSYCLDKSDELHGMFPSSMDAPTLTSKKPSESILSRLRFPGSGSEPKKIRIKEAKAVSFAKKDPKVMKQKIAGLLEGVDPKASLPKSFLLFAGENFGPTNHVLT